MFLNNYRRLPTVTLGLTAQEAADLVRACLRPDRSWCTTEAVSQGGWLTAALALSMGQHLLLPAQLTTDGLLEKLAGYSYSLEVECTLPLLLQLLNATDSAGGRTESLHHQFTRCLMHVSGMAPKPRAKDTEYPLRLEGPGP